MDNDQNKYEELIHDVYIRGNFFPYQNYMHACALKADYICRTITIWPCSSLNAVFYFLCFCFLLLNISRNLANSVSDLTFSKILFDTKQIYNNDTLKTHKSHTLCRHAIKTKQARVLIKQTSVSAHEINHNCC